FSAMLNGGDNSGAQSATVSVTQGQAGQAATGSISRGHTYLQAGTYTVQVSLVDDDNGQASTSFQVVVTASAPVPGTMPTLSGNEGSTRTFQVSFTDADAFDHITA